MVVRGGILTILIGMLLWLAAVPAQAEVEVTIDRNPVQVNESFQLVFSLDDTPDREPDFSSLRQHFMVLSNNRSNSISIINGEYRRSVKYVLQLMPKQIGEHVIPAIHFGNERSKPFEVTVQPSSLSSVPHEQLVLELLADRQQVPVQAQLVLTLRLLSGASLSAYQFSDLEIGGVDAVVEPLGDLRQYQTRIADQNYLVLEKRFAVFPQASGELRVEPAFAEARLSSRSGLDPFRIGGDIRRVRSDALSVEVTPIPVAFDGDDWIPASALELSEDWQGDPATLVAGEPVTRSLRLRARGLTAAQLPEIQWPAVNGIKQYPDQPRLENRRSADHIVGERVQEVALIPASAGNFYLPEIKLRWWNIDQQRVETATIPGREIIVRPAPASAAAVPAPATTPPEAATPLDEPERATTGRFWVWLSLLLAIGWAVTVALWWIGLAPRRQQHNARASAMMNASAAPGLRAAQAGLLHACAENDAVAVRRALLTWGQALLAPAEIDNLAALGAHLGAAMRAEIDTLNRSLYAPSGEGWQGEGLARLCRDIEQERELDERPAAPGLAPLNPTG